MIKLDAFLKLMDMTNLLLLSLCIGCIWLLVDAIRYEKRANRRVNEILNSEVKKDET